MTEQSVVYFDQQTGALQPVHWSKYVHWHFSPSFASFCMVPGNKTCSFNFSLSIFIRLQCSASVWVCVFTFLTDSSWRSVLWIAVNFSSYPHCFGELMSWSYFTVSKSEGLIYWMFMVFTKLCIYFVGFPFE